MIGVGLMSGTSLDGIDAVCVEIQPRDDSYHLEVQEFRTCEFPNDLRDELLACMEPHNASAQTFARLHQRLGECFADAVEEIRGPHRVDYVACHGQTIFHNGLAHQTWQLGDPFIVRERSSVTVCYDFRSGDTAAGGNGAPLVPYLDHLLWSSDHEDRVIVNIGGIANFTWLPKRAHREEIIAFDAGPGMMLLDAFVALRTNGRMRFDRDGTLAGIGKINQDLLKTMLEHPYFARNFPKSTGREQFGIHFLSEHDRELGRLSLEDGCATLAAVTSTALSMAIVATCPGATRILCSGGGVHHDFVMKLLRERLDGMCVETTAAMGIDPDAKEALAFAVLGYETLRGRQANVPTATGARKAVGLGAIAPWRLAALLAKMEAECRT